MPEREIVLRIVQGAATEVAVFVDHAMLMVPTDGAPPDLIAITDKCVAGRWHLLRWQSIEDGHNAVRCSFLITEKNTGTVLRLCRSQMHAHNSLRSTAQRMRHGHPLEVHHWGAAVLFAEFQLEVLSTLAHVVHAVWLAPELGQGLFLVRPNAITHPRCLRDRQTICRHLQRTASVFLWQLYHQT